VRSVPAFHVAVGQRRIQLQRAAWLAGGGHGAGFDHGAHPQLAVVTGAHTPLGLDVCQQLAAVPGLVVHAWVPEVRLCLRGALHQAVYAIQVDAVQLHSNHNDERAPSPRACMWCALAISHIAVGLAVKWVPIACITRKHVVCGVCGVWGAWGVWVCCGCGVVALAGDRGRCGRAAGCHSP
jgi:hypothetical protein